MGSACPRSPDPIPTTHWGRLSRLSLCASQSHHGFPAHTPCHKVLHCFAIDWLESSYDLRAVQELLGHKNVETTMIYTHVMSKPGLGVRSPLDG